MKSPMRTLFLSSVVASLAAAHVAPAQQASSRRPFTVHDLVALERLQSPQASPDGAVIAFVVRTTDLAQNRGRTDLWSIGRDGSGLRRLTTHEASDSEPRFAPDGKHLYFLSTRSGSSQVWRLSLQGGEAEPITALPLDVSTFELSPDGRSLALALDVFLDPEDCDLACTARRLDAPAGGGVGYDALLVRHWDTWKDGRRGQLFVVPLGGDGRATGAPVRVSRGVAGDVPSRPFGGAEEIAFSPDSRSIVFSSRAPGSGEAWSTNFDLYLAPVDGSRDAVALTAGNPAWDTQPSFTPDGRLVWLAMARPGYESDRLVFHVGRLAGGTLTGVRVLAGDWDRSPASYTVSADGRSLYAVAPDLGQQSLFSIDLDSGAVRKLVGEGTVDGVVAAGDRIVFLHDDLRTPADLHAVGRDGRDRRALTSWNAERLAAVAMGAAEQFTFTGAGGDTVHAYTVLPPLARPGERLPIALLVHGGPQGSFGNHFHYRWNPQTYAGAGYAAVMVDFHGSTGYGQAFTDAIRRAWGGAPLEDLERGLEAALARYPARDGERVCALGASYGGYMINWIAGQRPERFRCLVNHDGLFDLRSMYYSTEELWFPEWEMGGPYFADPDAHERWNPARFVERWRTPMLVIHGGLDYRVPDTQGLMTFSALQRRGVPSRLLYFPDENHWILRPANSIQWHGEVEQWLERWLRAGTGPTTTSGSLGGGRSGAALGSGDDRR